MARSPRIEQTINELLGSAHIFSSTASEVVEKRLLEALSPVMN